MGVGERNVLYAVDVLPVILFLEWAVSQAGPLSRADKRDLKDVSGLCSSRASPITNPHEGRAGLLFASVPILPDKE